MMKYLTIALATVAVIASLCAWCLLRNVQEAKKQLTEQQIALDATIVSLQELIRNSENVDTALMELGKQRNEIDSRREEERRGMQSEDESYNEWRIDVLPDHVLRLCYGSACEYPDSTAHDTASPDAANASASVSGKDE